MISQVYTRTTGSSPAYPQDLIYTKRVVHEVESMMFEQPWAIGHLTECLASLQVIIRAFEDAIFAEAQGDPILINNAILPHGLDYNWLRQIADILSSDVRVARSMASRKSRPRRPSTSTEKFTHAELVAREALKEKLLRNLPEGLKVASEIVTEAEAYSNAPWWSETMAAELKDLKDLVDTYRNLFLALAGLGRITVTPAALPHGPDYHGLEIRANAFRDDMKNRIPQWQREEAERKRAALVTSGEAIEHGYNQDSILSFITQSGEEKWLSKHSSIAKGAWSEVFRCRIWGEGQTFVAFKELRHRTLDHLTDAERLVQMKERMESEFNIWNQLDHPNIAQFLGHVPLPRPGLASRWYENGTVAEYLASNFNVNQLTVVKGCAKGLAYLHSNNVIHGDIRESNVLIDEVGNPVIADFGHAVSCQSELVQPVGSRAPTEYRYLARERVASKDERTASKESDVYSFGCLMLYIMTRHHPFRVIKTNEEVYWLLLQSEPPSMPGCPNDYPELAAPDPLWSLMIQCWGVVVDKRPAIRDVLAILEGSEMDIVRGNTPLSMVSVHYDS